MRQFLTSVGIGALTLSAPLAAQESASKYFIDLRAGAVVPTFDVADVIKSGGGIGVALGYRLTNGWQVIFDYDYGFHKHKVVTDADIKTMHAFAKLAYPLKPTTDKGWDAAINFGLGMLRFNIDDPGEDRGYFAINVGAKIAYNINEMFAIVLSPQGDIAFTKEEEMGSSTAWVWPLTAGLRVKF